MCQIMEDMRSRAEAFGEKKHARRTAVNMLKWSGLSYEKISECSELPLDEVKKLAADMERQAAVKA